MKLAARIREVWKQDSAPYHTNTRAQALGSDNYCDHKPLTPGQVTLQTQKYLIIMRKILLSERPTNLLQQNGGTEIKDYASIYQRKQVQCIEELQEIAKASGGHD